MVILKRAIFARVKELLSSNVREIFYLLATGFICFHMIYFIVVFLKKILSSFGILKERRYFFIAYQVIYKGQQFPVWENGYSFINSNAFNVKEITEAIRKNNEGCRGVRVVFYNEISKKEYKICMKG